MQVASARNNNICSNFLANINFQANIILWFSNQPVSNLSYCDFISIFTFEWWIIESNCEWDNWWVDWDWWDHMLFSLLIDCMTDSSLYTRDWNNIPSVCCLQIDFIHAKAFLDLLYLSLILNFSILPNCLDFVSNRHRPRKNSSDQHLTEILIALCLID